MAELPNSSCNSCSNCNGCNGCEMNSEINICRNEKVFIFDRRRKQIIAEAIILLVMFIVSMIGLYLIYICKQEDFQRNAASFLGGFLGGWTFDIKWFYKSIAFNGIGFGSNCERARKQILENNDINNQCNFEQFSENYNKQVDLGQAIKKSDREASEQKDKWIPERFYWRVFVPFVSAIFAYAVVGLILSGVILPSFKPVGIISYFSVSYIIGLFADIIYSKLAEWVSSKRVNENK